MVTTFYPPHIGGIEYHVENLSEQLVKRGHKITVLTSMLPGKKQSCRDVSPDGIDIYRAKTIFPSNKIYPSLSSQGIALNVQRTVKQIINEKHIDIIHTHGHHYYLTWRTIDTAKRLGIPSILTIHGLYALKPSDGIAQIEEEIFNRTIFTRELNRVDATIGLTKIITNYARKYCLKNNYFTIPNGVNQKIFTSNRKNRFDYRQKYNISADKIVVLFRGRFESIKGIIELAEAAKLVVKQNRRIFFVFVGGGSLTAELDKILQPIKENYQIIGWTPVNEIHELYLASDIFILPSKSEALPLTILEAMAAKLQIIATPVGGIPEVLEMYPYKTFIKKLDPISISMVIVSVAQGHKNLFSLNQEPEYMKNFDWQNIAFNVERVYFTALNRLN